MRCDNGGVRIRGLEIGMFSVSHARRTVPKNHASEHAWKPAAVRSAPQDTSRSRRAFAPVVSQDTRDTSHAHCVCRRWTSATATIGGRVLLSTVPATLSVKNLYGRTSVR